jgi:DNA topoisomerase-1
MASQMAPAKIDILILFIDTLNDNKSILDNMIWKSTIETIIFDGFLLLYNNFDEDEEKNENELVKVKINDILLFNKLNITEEYTKAPLRYNEAGLIKYLEKNNIGRPSTYE